MISRRSLFGALAGLFVPRVVPAKASGIREATGWVRRSGTVRLPATFNFYDCCTYVVRNSAEPESHMRGWQRLTLAQEDELKARYARYYPSEGRIGLEELLNDAIARHNYWLRRKLHERVAS